MVKKLYYQMTEEELQEEIQKHEEQIGYLRWFLKQKKQAKNKNHTKEPEEDN